MSELNIKVRKSQDNGSTFRATPDTLYMGGVGSAKVDTLHFEVPEEWTSCAITLHVQRLSGALPDPQMLDENNCVVVDRRWTQEKQGSWMLLAVDENGYIAMTKPGQYTCYETIDTNSTTETITPSVYEQFVALVKKWGQAAVDAARAAKESEERAAGSASASAGSAAAAARSESSAAGSATEAAGSASAAAESKTAAATSESNAAKHEKAAKKASDEAGAKAGTDKTLTIENAPADAAAVGDVILDRTKEPPQPIFYSKSEVDELLKAFMQYRGRVPNNDLNNAVEHGIYIYSAEDANLPDATGNQYGQLVVFATDNSGWIVQVAYSAWETMPAIRINTNGAGWTVWKSYANAEYISNDVGYMRFHWNGQDGQPTWLWGATEQGNSWLWNPNNFSVKYAAGSGNGITAQGHGYIIFGTGLRICWGYFSPLPSMGGYGIAQATATFATPFSDTNYVLVGNTQAIDGGSTWSMKMSSYEKKTTTQCVCNFGSGNTNGGTILAGTTFAYIAIGF